jgi:hypothetical protein
LLQLNQQLLPSKGAKGGAAAAAGTAAAAGGTAKPAAGALVTATVVAVHELELEMAVGKVCYQQYRVIFLTYSILSAAACSALEYCKVTDFGGRTVQKNMSACCTCDSHSGGC